MPSITLDGHPTKHVQLAPLDQQQSAHSASMSAASKRTSVHPTSVLPSSKRLKATDMPSKADLTDPERWFDDTNKNATAMHNVSFHDNDPPFYVGKQSSSGGFSACAVPSAVSDSPHLGPPTAPTKSLLERLDSNRSSSEGFRSVIDDLTVKNKRLKRKLRKYERLHCSHLQDEKLFEVRIHGLPVHRKRELEETLRQFASSIENDLMEPPGALVPSPLKDAVFTDASALRKPSSTSTLCSKPALDSAYASMSAEQTGQSNNQQPDKISTDQLVQRTQARQENLKSYLHDILQPPTQKHSMAMSERSKSKEVVKRLEQIFTGKGAASSHDQSHQQEEISQSAAQIERKARGQPFAKEGLREALILPPDTELQVDSSSEATVAALQSRQSNDGRASSRSTQFSGTATPEQRPTRPLDLDVHRAQVPADNLEYIRHLGLAPAITDDPQSDGEGWVFLNLLISMAQLHIFNVTPEFIRHAIMDCSQKIELSVDGTKVKWQGGGEGTQMSSDGEEDEDSKQPMPMAGSLSGVPNKTAKRRPTTYGQSTSENKFHYKPLFFHGSAHSDDSGNGSISSSDSPMDNDTGWNSGMNSGSHGLREAEVTLRRQNASVNGPVIFYHKARFCTDLSGDPSCSTTYTGTYDRLTDSLVGCPSPPSSATGNDTTDEDILDGSLPNDLAGFTSDTFHGCSSLDLDELKCCISDYAASIHSAPSPTPVDMEVSGLAGIQPEDNFMFKVQVRHKKIQPSSKSMESIIREQQIPRSQPTPSLDIVSSTKLEMAPSRLPQPSFFCAPYSSSGSVSDDTSDDRDVVQYQGRLTYPSSPADDGIAFALRSNVKAPSLNRTKNSSYTFSSSDGSDDSSIDLLAHARELDPDAVAAREREFDSSNNPPPESSAVATLGETSVSQLSGAQLIGAGHTESDVDSMSVDGDGDSVGRSEA